MIKIDKKIPLVVSELRGRPAKYPWDELKIGDSFLLDTANPNSAACMTCNAGKRYNKRFTARKTNKGYRVWRIA